MFKGIDRPDLFVVLGVLDRSEGVRGPSSAEPRKQDMNEKIATMLAAPNDTRQHTALSVAPAQVGKAGVCAVTHVDVDPAAARATAPPQ